MKKLKIALCEGRHAIPEATDGAVFGQTIADPTDLKAMAQTVRKRLCCTDAVDLYVTGLTVALGEVIRYCAVAGIELTLWHYDRNSDSYYPQTLFVRDQIAEFDFGYSCVTGASRG